MRNSARVLIGLLFAGGLGGCPQTIVLGDVPIADVVRADVHDVDASVDIPDPAAFVCMRALAFRAMCGFSGPCAPNDTYESCLASESTRRAEWVRARAECMSQSPVVCDFEDDAAVQESQCEFDALVRLGPSDAAIAAGTALCSACPGSAGTPLPDGGWHVATNFAECMRAYFPPDRGGFWVPGLALVEGSDWVNDQIRVQCPSTTSLCAVDILSCVQRDFADVYQPCIDASAE